MLQKRPCDWHRICQIMSLGRRFSSMAAWRSIQRSVSRVELVPCPAPWKITHCDCRSAVLVTVKASLRSKRQLSRHLQRPKTTERTGDVSAKRMKIRPSDRRYS